jgi:alpha-tubulin suppressor-like RCC1 family protein
MRFTPRLSGLCLVLLGLSCGGGDGGLRVDSAADAGGLTGPARVAVASGHRCVTRGGRVWCWGADDYGQTGQGAPDLAGREQPAQVPGITDALEVVVSDQHSCALLGSGRVTCWGHNSDGESGAVSAPALTCRNFLSHMGPVDAPCQPTPTEVPGVEGAVQLTVADRRSCALLATGRVACWGQAVRGSGWLTGVVDPVAITLGDQAACVILRDDSLDCQNPQPWTVQEWTYVRRVVMAGQTDLACVLGSDGRVACWGSNAAGQRGLGYADYQIPFPEDPPAIGGHAVDAAVGWAHVCASMVSGEVRCWGRNTYGAVGFPTDQSATCSAGPCQLTPRTVMGLPPILQIAAGGYTSCGVTSDSKLYCWGSVTSGHSESPVVHIRGPWEDPG